MIVRFQESAHDVGPEEGGLITYTITVVIAILYYNYVPVLNSVLDILFACNQTNCHVGDKPLCD